jgi:hypothetical protein
LPLKRHKGEKEMSEIRVNVEGAPEAVAKFFKEMGQTQISRENLCNEVSEEVINAYCDHVVNETAEPKEEKKTRKPRQKKEDKVEVTEEAPDPEFEGVPGEEVIEAQVTERESIEEKVEETAKNEQDIPEREISLPEVKEALKEYGLWVVEQGNESHSAKEYLVALLRKYGKVEASKDLDAEGRNAVFHAAVDRVPMEELEEFI